MPVLRIVMRLKQLLLRLRLLLLVPLCLASWPLRGFSTSNKPNIVLILCDDLGYGDVHALNPDRGKIPTPNMDRLAAQGMSFTDAHSGSSVCTPTRYGILTGRYAWRTRLQSGVLYGFSPPLIEGKRLTLPRLLRQSGYRTAAIGKWHLGLTFAAAPGVTFDDSDNAVRHGQFDPAKPIADGPLSHGFDYFFGISASLDMPPFAFIEGDRFTEAPVATKKWLRSGLAAPGFDAEAVLPEISRRATTFIEGSSSNREPLFLYLALTSPHTPILPTKEWQGKSGLSAYGDFVMETDWALGEIMGALDRTGLATNTLLFFTSDNGCSPAANIPQLEAKGHFPSARFRGYKADIFDGGHRIPLIVRWPGRIKPGAASPQLVCLSDLMATCADLLDLALPPDAAEDSFSFLPLLQGTSDAPIREAVIHHSINGSFAVRQGRWKLELCPDSGGWSRPAPGSSEARSLPPIQLYDLAQDEGERKNLCREHAEIVARLTRSLETYIRNGRSTPGKPQQNDVPVTTKPKR
jgi:arylsulfatase A